MSVNSAVQAGDLAERTVAGNDKAISLEGDYVLVVLNRALRGEDNPVIDAAIAQANALNKGVIVYSEANATEAHMCDRLLYFTLGALKELALSLKKKNIPCVQVLRASTDGEVLAALISKAAAIYTDEDHTVWDRSRLTRLLNMAAQSVFLIDASRLVPVRSLPQGLKTTPEFRKAHSGLRDRYAELRKVTSVQLQNAILEKGIEVECRNFADCDDATLRKLVAQCDINHAIGIAQEHLPVKDAIATRISTLQKDILAKYKWIRNNAALKHSTSMLSPYLHFGMISPHQVLAAIEATDVPKSYTWKFRDEFLTWREWSHYQAFYTPDLHEYEALPNKAKQTLEDHANDERPELKQFEDILQGNTSDNTWNAAQREWLHTGWLHNNLRMYWAKQILRFTPSPEKAWKTACYLNDTISLDGRDPATYASMRWAFGDAKPGYSEKEIYGWVSPKSDRAILKRSGMKSWIEKRVKEV